MLGIMPGLLSSCIGVPVVLSTSRRGARDVQAGSRACNIPIAIDQAPGPQLCQQPADACTDTSTDT
jgi:hypothetical protein